MIYDSYGKNNKQDFTTSIWKNIADKDLDMEIGIYQLMMNFAVYASAAAILVSIILLLIATHRGGERIKESKSLLIKTLIVSTLIFAVAGVVKLVNHAGIR